MWYTDYARSRLGRYDPATRAFEEWVTPNEGGRPYGIAIGVDGRVWYAETATGLMVAADPATGAVVRTLKIPTPNAVVRHMVSDPERGDLWLALSGTGRIGRIALGAPGGS